MTRGEFEKLTERYRTGKCSPEEIAFVERWVEMNGRLHDADLVFDSENEAEKTGAEIWKNIRKQTEEPKQRRFRVSRWINAAGVAAACVACVVLIWNSGHFTKKNGQTEPDMVGVETMNASQNQQRIVLPDSSVVTLAQGAGIVTSERYGEGTRTVRLTGEAFFEVRPNRKVPFLVYSGDLVTEVLGTSFAIRPETGKKTIEVSVVTGKVSVYSSEKDRNQRRSGVIITPNQKVVYDVEKKTIREDIVDHPKMVKETPELSFNFDEVVLREVLSTLQQAYETEIVVGNPELNECVFTGNLSGYGLFKQLDYVCDVLGANYEIRGTTIFLNGEACGSSR
ncbi:FecR family protein [Ravibacter arvi]|uniref:FecR family protein n=1 Tax=Ravibacter arvi TaxID=2051041 RepID=A0ABP8LWD8_9BACT